MSLFRMIKIIRWLRHYPLKRMDPIWFALGYTYRMIVKKCNILIKQDIGGYGPFKLDSIFAFSDFSNWGKGHNNAFHRCVEASRGKTCVLDIGAHIGLVSLPCASVMASDGKLFAFEPASANRDLLLKHIRVNNFSDMVTVNDCLVGRVSRSSVDFFESSEHSGQNSVASVERNISYEKRRRRQTTLDIFCSANNLRPEVIKIDVEGAEIDVLLGALETIRSHRPIIILSVHPRLLQELGHHADDIKDIVNELGYHCLDQDGNIVEEFKFSEYVLTPKGVYPCP